MQLNSLADTQSQAAQKDQGTEKADALFDVYKDPTDDCIGPEGQASYTMHAWQQIRVAAPAIHRAH